MGHRVCWVRVLPWLPYVAFSFGTITRKIAFDCFPTFENNWNALHSNKARPAANARNDISAAVQRRQNATHFVSRRIVHRSTRQRSLSDLLPGCFLKRCPRLRCPFRFSAEKRGVPGSACGAGGLSLDASGRLDRPRQRSPHVGPQARREVQLGEPFSPAWRTATFYVKSAWNARGSARQWADARA